MHSVVLAALRAVAVVGLCSAAQAQAPAAPPSPDTVTTHRLGPLQIEEPWIRATPDGARVAGGYLRVINTGTEPDRLVATTLPIAARAELHEMSNEGGVMKMNEVAGGIAIPPGGVVELKPGGLHLMFMELRSGAREGQSIAGTLTFAKAGTIAVTFRVGGLGARTAPPASSAARHQH